MNRKPVVIKKYENRRLYDTTNSRYINQDEVAQMLKNGYDVQVVDAATGEDLTRLVLTQIIVEQAKEPDSAFPLEVLRQMVVASSRATQEGALKYMKTVAEMYQNAYRAMTPPLHPFDFMQAQRPAPSQPFSSSEREEEYRQPRAAGGGEVDELKRRVAELESLVERPKKKKKIPKKSSSPRRKA
ncbi:MAG: polyhydroxyalkanoate synthesis regulator DNA-binding domain-containing protein [Candidatus Sulfotelmatobacter sp.]|jgi:polyhydroxyalkanoate synthesis repressor PhaR